MSYYVYKTPLSIYKAGSNSQNLLFIYSVDANLREGWVVIIIKFKIYIFKKLIRFQRLPKYHDYLIQ